MTKSNRIQDFKDIKIPKEQLEKVIGGNGGGAIVFVVWPS